jgi:hypothetical protein
MPEATAAELWQVRVPLPDGQFLNLYYDPQRSIHPVLFSTFPVLLERYFKYQPLSNSPALVRPQDTQAIETA